MVGRNKGRGLSELYALQEQADGIFSRRFGGVRSGPGSSPAPEATSPPVPQTTPPPQALSMCRGVVVGAGYGGQMTRAMPAACAAARRLHELLPSLGVSERLLLCDDGGSDAMPPTRANITDAARWLATGAQSGEGLVFAFAGYAGQLRGRDGTTTSALCPSDQKRAGMLSEDELVELLLSPLPAGARLLFLSDVPYGLSPIDLPWQLWAASDGVGEREKPAALHARASGAEVFVLKRCSAPESQSRTQAGALLDAFCMAMARLPAPTLRAVVANVAEMLCSGGTPSAVTCAASIPFAWDQGFSLLPHAHPPPVPAPVPGPVPGPERTSPAPPAPASPDSWGGALRHAALQGWTPQAGPPQPPPAVAAAAAAAAARAAYENVAAGPSDAVETEQVALHVSAPSGCRLQLSCAGFGDPMVSPPRDVQLRGPQRDQSDGRSPPQRDQSDGRSPPQRRTPGQTNSAPPLEEPSQVDDWDAVLLPSQDRQRRRRPQSRRKRRGDDSATASAPTTPRRGSTRDPAAIERERRAAAERAAARHREAKAAEQQRSAHDESSKEILRAARRRERDAELGTVRRYQRAKAAAESDPTLQRERAMAAAEHQRRREEEQRGRAARHAERLEHYATLRLGERQPNRPVPLDAVWAAASPARSVRSASARDAVAEIAEGWAAREQMRRAGSSQTAGHPLTPRERAVMRKRLAQRERLRGLHHVERGLIQSHLEHRAKLHTQLQRQLQNDSTDASTATTDDDGEDTLDTASAESRAMLAERGVRGMPALSRAAAMRAMDERDAVRAALRVALPMSPSPAPPPHAFPPTEPRSYRQEVVSPARTRARRAPLSPAAPVLAYPPLRSQSPQSPPTEDKKVQTPPASGPGPLVVREHNTSVLKHYWWLLRRYKAWKGLRRIAGGQEQAEEEAEAAEEWVEDAGEGQWIQNEETGEWEEWVLNTETGEWEVKAPSGEEEGEWEYDEETGEWRQKEAEAADEHWVWSDEKGDYEYYDWVWSDAAGDYEWAVATPPEE